MRVAIETGMSVLTPVGVETILSIDITRDMVTTSRGNEYAEEKLRATERPESHEPTDVEAWLSGPELILITSFNKACTCTCGGGGREVSLANSSHCDWFVVVRGDKKTVTHQPGPACRCGPSNECCGYPLG